MSASYSLISFNAGAKSGVRIPVGMIYFDNETTLLKLSSEGFRKVKRNYSSRELVFLEMALKSYFGKFFSSKRKPLLDNTIEINFPKSEAAKLAIYENGIINFSTPQKIETEELGVKHFKQLFELQVV